MLKINRWMYLFLSTLVMLFLGLIYAWSIFTKPFSQMYTEWSLTGLSATFTISMIFFCIGGIVSGKLATFLSSSTILRTSAVLLSAGFILVSMIDNIPEGIQLFYLYLSYGVLGGGGVGIGYNSIISTVNRAFRDKTGLATGTIMMGFGLGAIMLGGLTGSLIETLGLFLVFRILGIAILVIMLIASLFTVQVDTSAEKVALNVDSDVASTPKEMVRTSDFIFYCAWVLLICSAGLLVINSATSISASFGLLPIMGLIVSVFNGLGRVIMGTLFDMLKTKKTILLNTVMLVVAALCFIIGNFTGMTPIVILGFVLTGISYGGAPAITSPFINKTFGMKHFSINFGVTNTVLIPAAIIGPLLSSKMIEHSNGSYLSTFYLLLGLAVFALIPYLKIKE